MEKLGRHQSCTEALGSDFLIFNPLSSLLSFTQDQSCHLFKGFFDNLLHINITHARYYIHCVMSEKKVTVL